MSPNAILSAASIRAQRSGTRTAPGNGRVANLALRPGVRATQFATMPVMSFIEEDEPCMVGRAFRAGIEV